MKTNKILIPVFLLACLASCHKEKSAEPEKHGTNFERLIKTVTSFTNVDRDITQYFSYDGSGRMSENKIVARLGSSAETYTETFYRNAAGAADSIVATGKSADTFYYRASTEFKYDPNGRMIYSIWRTFKPGDATLYSRDSSVYSYTGNNLSGREDYMAFGTGPYNSMKQRLITYQIDNNDNLVAIRIKETSAGTHEFHCTYDNKVNPLPDDRTVFFYMVPLLLHDYHSANNISTINYGNFSSEETYQYTYMPNNKPLKRNMYENNSTLVSRITLFYYD